MHERGLILLTTLAMMIMMTLLLMTQMQQLLLYTKALGQENARFDSRDAMETFAEQFIKKDTLLGNENCIFEQDDANGILKKILKKGCQVEGYAHYTFLVEDLGFFDCLVIEKGGKQLVSHHYRLTIIEQSESDRKLFLQLRIIKASAVEGSCIGFRAIREGISGWRFSYL